MPADPCSSAVLCHEYLLQLLGIQTCKVRGDFADRQQERRNVIGPVHHPLAEIVAPTVIDYAPLAEVAVKLEFLERKDVQLAKKRLFVGGCENVFAVSE